MFETVPLSCLQVRAFVTAPPSARKRALMLLMCFLTSLDESSGFHYRTSLISARALWARVGRYEWANEGRGSEGEGEEDGEAMSWPKSSGQTVT